VTRDWRTWVCAALSIGGHLAFAYGMSRLPRRAEAREKPAVVAIRVVSPPPSLEPPPEPPRPTPLAPRPVPHERARARPTPEAPHDPVPRESPPPEPAPSAGAATTPVFGVTMESTSQAGSGPAMPVGNSARATGTRAVAPGVAKPLAPPVPAYEATNMPLPKGRCVAKYNEAALAAAIEGTVVLDLVVDENGRVREAKVVRGLGHGLDEAALVAIKECRFTPGDKQGTPVPMRISEFKFRFFLPGNE
jgi:protein TonB